MSLRANYMAISSMVVLLMTIIEVGLASDCVGKTRMSSDCGDLTVYAKVDEEQLSLTIVQPTPPKGIVKMTIGGLKIECHVSERIIGCPEPMPFPLSITATPKGIKIGEYTTEGEVVFETGFFSGFVEIVVAFSDVDGTKMEIILSNGTFTESRPLWLWTWVFLFCGVSLVLGGLTAYVVVAVYNRVKARADARKAAANPAAEPASGAADASQKSQPRTPAAPPTPAAAPGAVPTPVATPTPAAPPAAPAAAAASTQPEPAAKPAAPKKSEKEVKQPSIETDGETAAQPQKDGKTVEEYEQPEDPRLVWTRKDADYIRNYHAEH